MNSLFSYPAALRRSLRPGIIGVLAGLVFVISALMFVASAPMQDFMKWIADDAFYYYQVARNIVSGNGATFDGSSWTNGWHPLYMLLSIAVQAIFGAGSDLAVRAQFIINSIMFASAGVILARTVQAKRGSFLAAGIVLVLWFSDSRLMFAALNGVEMALVLFTCATLLYFALKVFDANRGLHWSILSLLCAVTILSRLDLGLVIMPLMIWFTFRALVDRSAGVRLKLNRLCWLALPCAVIAIVYVSLNFYFFHLPMPISGIVKRAWAISWLQNIKDSHLHYGLYCLKGNLLEVVLPIVLLKSAGMVVRIVALLSGLGLLLVVAVTGSFPRILAGIRRDSTRWVAMAMGGFGCLLHLSYYSFFQLDTRGWYWAPEYIFIYLSVAMFVAASVAAVTEAPLIRNWKLLLPLRQYAGIVLAVLALTVPYLTVSRMAKGAQASYNAWDGFYYEAAMWIRSSLPQATTAGAWDAGAIGYFSGLRVTNLDGLANSSDFLPYVNDSHNLVADTHHHVRDYVYGKRLRYVVLNRTVGQDDPEQLKAEICSDEISCRVIYFEYRTNTGGTRRWLSIIELTYPEAWLRDHPTVSARVIE